MPKRALAIIISILILTSHFDATLRLRTHGEEKDVLTVLRRIEEELEKGRIPSGSITEANFIVPEGFPVELAKKLWLFVAQLVSTGCSKNEARRAIIEANDTLKLPARIYYELKNYTIIPKYDEAQVIQSNDGSVSVEIPYRVVDGSGKDIDVSSIEYESNGTNLFHVLRRYPKRRTYLVRTIDPDAYTFTFMNLKTGEIFNKTARMDIGLFSNVTRGYFGFESFIVAVPGHFEERREAVKSQVSEFRVLLPAYDPLIVDTAISQTKAKIGDVITISAQIRNPQEAKNFRILLDASFDKEAFEAWASTPAVIHGPWCLPIYLYLKAKKPGVYQITVYFAVVEPKSLDVVFWNGGKTVTYEVTVLPEAPRLKVKIEAEALAKFANFTITLVNSGGQEAKGVKLFITGDVEEKELEIGRVWHTWKGNVITKLLSPIAKVNVTVVYYDLDGKRHTSTSLMTISTMNFVIPEKWGTYLIEVPEYEETKRVFVPGHEGATHVRLYLMESYLAPPSIGFFAGLSLIPISPNGFTLTLENASNVAEISSKLPEVRYMLLDVKPGFLCERILREDEVKKFFHINEDERIELNKISPGYEVKLLKEEALNQSEIVTVDDEFYEKLKYNNWEDYDYKYEDTGVKKWDLDKAIAKVSHEKTIELIYRPLTYQGDGLVKGVLVKNYAAMDMAYELELLGGPWSGAPLGISILDIQAYGTIPLNVIQLKSASYPTFIQLKYHGKVIASLHVYVGGEASEFWRGFWDGIKEKLPGIIITAAIMVILAIPTHGGSLLAYVKDLLASAVIPSLLAVGVASNIKELFEAHSAYAKMDEVAEELEGFSQRAAYAGYSGAYHLFQGLKGRIGEGQRYIVGSTALDMLADVTIRELLIAFGMEDATEYERGRATGRLVGAALSITGYATMYYKFLSNGPKLLSLSGKVKAFLRGVYNWITPPIWDAIVLAGKLTARAIAASLVISEGSDDFKQRLNEIKDDEGSLSSLVEFTGKFLDDALDVLSRLGLSEEAFFGLLWAYGKCKLEGETWNKFFQEIESIGGKSERCTDELLRSIFNAEGSEVEYVVLRLAPKLAELSSEELGRLEKFLEAGFGMKEIGNMLERPGGLEELLAGVKSFDLALRPREVTLRGGKDVTLNLGKGNELDPGTYVTRVYWEFGNKKGVIEFPIKKDVKSDVVTIPRHCSDQVLNEIGKDEARIKVIKAEFLDYKLFFPKEFLVGGKGIGIDLFHNEMKIDRRIYRFKPDTDIGKRGLYVDAEFEGNNIRGRNLVLSFYQDGEVRIRYGEHSYPIKEMSVDTSLELIMIKYEDYDEVIYEAEYSFNLRPLSEQMGKHFYEVPVGKGRMHLKEHLFRLLGFDALNELEGSIGSKYGVIVEYHNGKMTYCGNKEFHAYVPDGASEVRWIRIVSIEGSSDPREITYYLLRVIEADNLEKVRDQIGEAGERIVILGYRGIDYREIILMEFSKKTGIPLETLKIGDTVGFQHMGGDREPDGRIFALKDIEVNGKVVFKKDDTIVIIEVKSSAKGESPEELCEVAMGEKGLKRYINLDKYKDVQYGIAIGFSYDPVRALAGEPGTPPLIKVCTKGELGE